MSDQINYYQILGVPRNASESEIRNAYRRLAKERHPDRPGGSQEEFSRLQEANAVLNDPNRRRQHDEALDLAYAAEQLSDLNLDFGDMEDELAARREQRESSGPSLGERLRDRFGRKDEEPEERPSRGNRGGGRSGGGSSGRGRSEGGSRRGRYEVREARWYEPQDFDPDPITWNTAGTTLLTAFVAFILVGQLGLWATRENTVPFTEYVTVLGPFMPILYTLVGLVVAYFAFRSAGYAALALVFVAGLVVGQSGGPEDMTRFVAVGVGVLLVVIWLGSRRDRAARERAR